MNRIILPLFFMLILAGCESKKKEKSDVPAANFLVNDYIKGQVAILDTARFSFRKIEMINGQFDTVVIKNSDIRRYAQDFLSLPDLSSEDLKDDYQVSHLYDELQKAFVFTYSTKANHLVRQQHVTVEPEMDPQGKSNIRSVYVDYWDDKQGLSVRKNMMWQVNSFYITTTTEMPGQPQKITTLKIIWNGFENENQQKER